MDFLLTLGIWCAVIGGGIALGVWCDRADEHDRRTATQARILADAQAVATAADDVLTLEAVLTDSERDLLATLWGHEDIAYALGEVEVGE